MPARSGPAAATKQQTRLESRGRSHGDDVTAFHARAQVGDTRPADISDTERAPSAQSARLARLTVMTAAGRTGPARHFDAPVKSIFSLDEFPEPERLCLKTEDAHRTRRGPRFCPRTEVHDRRLWSIGNEADRQASRDARLHRLTGHARTRRPR